MRNEAQKASRKKYETSAKGKAAKKRHEATYVVSGGRGKAEARRSSKPVSEVRKQARLRYQLVRRGFERNLDEFDRLVLTEAVDLMRKRSAITGISWHVDHVIPVSKGGNSSAANLQVVPASWNRSKSNAHTERFFGAIERK